MVQKSSNECQLGCGTKSKGLLFVAGIVLLVSSIIYFTISSAVALVFLLAVSFTVLLLFSLNLCVVGKSDFRCSESDDLSNQVLGFLIAKMVMADGKSTESELAVAKSRLQSMFRSKKAGEVLDCVYLYLNTSVNEADGVSEMEQLKEKFGYLQLLAVAEMLFTIAVKQGGIVDAEWNFLGCVLAHLGLSDSDSAYLVKKYEQFRVADKQTDDALQASPYAILGVADSADAELVKAAYDKLVERYKAQISDGGALKGVAEEKLSEVEFAYNKLIA